MANINYIKERIEDLKREYPELRKEQDYRLFTLLCLKYFYFNDVDDIDPTDLLDKITDGKSDGGIDAIFNDPNSDNNDMVIIQSKYYEQSDLTVYDAVAELEKMVDTIQNIDNCKVSAINEQVVSAYRWAKSSMVENGAISLAFFSSYKAKSTRERNSIEKKLTNKYSKENSEKQYNIELNLYNEIQTQIETVDSGKLCVDYDQLEIDRPNNCLRYEESIIVNISAMSLQQLQNRRGNSLLGMNLRYYIKNKGVDDGIKATIEKESENFWYKNNGIIIICDDFELDGKYLKLYDFSIINGGQTTNRVGRLDIEKDFYLQCKVVKKKGTTQNDQDKFAHSIAEATNSQKPIKKSDLVSNTPEQLRLNERLRKVGVFYITKKGDKPPKSYYNSYTYTKIEEVGKLSLAAVLQMPGSARSSAQRMYQNEYYYSIFGSEAKEGVIADALKISYYYDNFVKNDLSDRGYDEKTVLPMIKNGKTFQLASISFLCKIVYGVFKYDDVSCVLDDTDQLKLTLRKMNGMERIISNKIEDEDKVFYQIFDKIGDEVLGYCYSDALDKAYNDKRTLAPSDYLKSDNTYYRDVIKRLWKIYKNDDKLKDSISMICGSKN